MREPGLGLGRGLLSVFGGAPSGFRGAQRPWRLRPLGPAGRSRLGATPRPQAASAPADLSPAPGCASPRAPWSPGRPSTPQCAPRSPSSLLAQLLHAPAGLWGPHVCPVPASPYRWLFLPDGGLSSFLQFFFFHPVWRL